MSSQLGTLTVADLISNEHQTVAEFGENTIAEVLQRDLAVLNAQVNEQLEWLSSPATTLDSRLGLYGVSNQHEFAEMDELGQPAAVKQAGGQTVGFPLRKYGGATGWTQDYLAQTTVADFARRFSDMQQGYLRALQKQLKLAIYTPTNASVTDRLVENSISLPVKAFLNADSSEIPNGPNGETFDGSTLTHYRANASWDNALLLADVEAVADHGWTNELTIVIHRANKSDIEGLAGFTAYHDDRIVAIANDRTVELLDRENLGNRKIGIFGDAEVWIKPWAIQNYVFITDPGQTGRQKPLRFRQHHVASMRGLRMANSIPDYPLTSQIMDAYFGFGVQNRSNGLVRYFGGGSYVAPSL